MRRGVLLLAAGVATTVPPDGGDGVEVVRQQAEVAAADYFATVDEGGATHVVCEAPSADAAGVTFLCFGVNGAGTPLVVQATINDYGSADFTAVGSSPTATTGAPTTTSADVRVVHGSGSEVVQVDPITGPTIIAVAHDGAGEFTVQPQQGGVPAGPPAVSATGPWSGRYLVGLGGTISGFAVTADGTWTLRVQQRTSALTIDPATGVSGETPDVAAYADVAAWAANVDYDGPGPIVVRSVTVTGSQELVNEAGAFSGEVEVPAGPGFVTVDAVGAWSLQPV